MEVAFFKCRFNARTPEQERIVENYVTPLIRHEGDEVVNSGDSTLAKI
jgi:hypothetical protein